MKRRMFNPFQNPFERKAMDFPEGVGGDYYPSYTDHTKPEPYYTRWSTDKAIQEGYESSEWVYIAVSKIAITASSIPWRIYRELDDGSREPYEDVAGTIHPIQQLLTNPNPYMNGNDFLELLTQHLMLGGNSLNKATMFGGVPVAFTPIMPDLVDVIPSPTKFIDHYDIWKKRGDSQPSQKLKPEEVMHIKFVDPNNLWWGIAPLMAVARTVDTDVEAINWNKVSLQNRAVSSGSFIIDQAVTPDQYEQLRKMIKEQHSGAQNSYAPWLLSHGMDWKPMSMTNQELDFINSRKMNRESILAVYGVPPPMAGVYDSATYNNIVTARLSFWLDTVIPYLDNIRTAMIFYFKQFSAWGNDWILDYDTSNIDALKPPLVDRVNAAKTLFGMGVPMNTLNTRFELDLPPDLEFGDVSFVSGVQATENVVSGTPIAPAPNNNNPPQPAQPPASNPMLESFSNPFTVDGRDEIWAATDKSRRKYERPMEKVAYDQLKKDYKYIAIAFADDGRIPKLPTKTWTRKMVPLSATIVQDYGNKVMKDIQNQTHAFRPARTFAEDDGFLLTDEIMNFLNDWFEVRAVQYNATTIDTVKVLIKDGQDNGLTTKEIAQEIEDLGILQEYRAVNISRTEVCGLQNYSIIESSKQSGLVEEKVWVSSRDSRVRDTHRQLDGQTVPLDAPFSVEGEMLLHPGDPNASAALIVNCRCAITFVLKNSQTQSNKMWYNKDIVK